MLSFRQLVELPWETRNLGMPSFELVHLDSETELIEILSEIEHAHAACFIQAKLDKSKIALSMLLERNGFYFVETALSPFTVFSKNVSLARFKGNRSAFLPERFELDRFELLSADKADSIVRSHIRRIANESFVDDRFHVDPNCAKELADGRYVNWVGDMLEDDRCVFDLLTYDNTPIAFMGRRHVSLLLAGFVRKYAQSGLGEFFWLSVLAKMAEEHIDKAVTTISVNNMAVLNLYARIGFRFRNPLALYHCWIKPKA